MDEIFIGTRITQLRLARNVSEYQMSLELGQSKSYIQGITSGKNMPSVKQLFNIADYLGVSLSEFFDDGHQDSVALLDAVKGLRKLGDGDIALLMGVTRRISALAGAAKSTDE